MISLNRLFTGSITIAVLLLLGVRISSSTEHPNFIFLLSDDQPWKGLSCRMHPDIPGSASPVIETPNIAELAEEGMRFSAAYSPSPVCSPTRISLQTGKSPAQCQWTKAAPTMSAEDGFKLIPPKIRKGIEESEVTIAEVLRRAGYATAHYGKWHLQGGGPELHGYDESDGETGNNDAEPFVEPNPVDIFGMGERAAAFMEKSKAAGKPFFIQMSYHALHYPENASKALVEKYRGKMAGRDEKGIGRAAISEDLDRGVGELLAAVDRLGLREDTYVIYLSDNGGSARGTLRGGKGDAWEGGIRVPMIVRGPGVPVNSWCHERVVGFDWFPTFCELAGVRESLPKELEGGSISHLLVGEKALVERPREELVFHFPHYQGDTPHTALFLGDYKLMRFYEDGDAHLFNISKDMSEADDLAEEMPGKVREMTALMDAYLDEVGAQLPEPNPLYDPNNPPSIPKGGDPGGGKRGKGRGRRNGEGGKGRRAEKESARTLLPQERPDFVLVADTDPRREKGGKGRGTGPGREQSPVFGAIDGNGDGKIDDEELRTAAERLLSLDSNHNGKLEREEYEGRPPRPEGGKGPRPGEVGTEKRTPWLIVHAPELDFDGDGVVDWETELLAEANKVFDGYDKDGNKSISEEETQGRGVRSPLGGFVQQHAAELDRDRSGGISREELIGQFRQFFERTDKNGDGRLTKDEYEIEGEVVPRFPDRQKAPGRQDAYRQESSGRSPNLVFVLVDDLGWNGTGYAGNEWIDTPRIDGMAREGMVFSNAYASAPNCAPTRACLMSGQYPPRHGIYTVVDDRHSPGQPHHKILAAESRSDLATESVTIAEALKQGGYATGMFGMWNLGRGREGPTTPLGQGFDVFLQPRDAGFEKDRFFREDGEYLTDVLTTSSIEWIEKNRQQPFFLYLAYHAVHSPFEPKPDLVKKYRDKGAPDPDYAATVEAVDQNIGRILDAIRKMGLQENTVVIFHSDNGGTRQYIRPLNGGKGTLYEGGIRVPTVVWGAGISAGELAEPILSMDFYPTLLELAGLTPPEEQSLDGESLVALLSGKAEGLQRDQVFWHFPSYIGGGGPCSAMRKGDWKVIEFFESGTAEVYDLSSDPNETRNLVAEDPDKAAELLAGLHNWQEQTGAPRPTKANPAYDPDAVPKRGRDQRGKPGDRG